MTIPLAHAGHWLAEAMYAVPVVVIVGWLSIRSLLDRRAERREQRHDAG